MPILLTKSLLADSYTNTEYVSSQGKKTYSSDFSMCITMSYIRRIGTCIAVSTCSVLLPNPDPKTVLFGSATVLSLLWQCSRNTVKLGQKTAYVDFLNKRVPERLSVCACSCPPIYFPVGQRLSEPVLVLCGKAGTSWQ